MQEIQFMGGSNSTHAHPNYLIYNHVFYSSCSKQVCSNHPTNYTLLSECSISDVFVTKRSHPEWCLCVCLKSINSTLRLKNHVDGDKMQLRTAVGPLN